MPTTVKAWKTEANLKAFIFFLLLIFSLLIMGFIIVDNPVALVLVLLTFALIPVLGLSPFAMGKHESITAEVLGEAEIDRCHEHRWIWIIPVVAFATVGLLTQRYNLLINAFSFLILAFVLSRQKVRVLLTDKGLVWGKTLIVGLDEIEKAEVRNGYAIIRKNSLQRYVVPFEVLEQYRHQCSSLICTCPSSSTADSP